MSQPELLEQIFICSPVYNAIFVCLSPADIYRVRRTCKLVLDATNHFHELAYNINRHLSHFFNDPIAIRRIQARTKLLISGSNALQFLDRTFYPESDLDVFAYPDSVKEIGTHLIKSEGYEFIPGEKQPKTFEQVAVKERDFSSTDLRRSESHHSFVYMTGMSELFRFKRPLSDVEIQVVSTSKAPLDCILYFHSSCVMNFITHDTAYAMYPAATFDKRISLAFGIEHHERTKKAYRKYADRGWSFPATLNFATVKGLEPLILYDRARHLDDPYTWRVSLNTDELSEQIGNGSSSSKPFSSDPFHCNSWTLKRTYDSWSPVMTLGMTYQIFHSPHFQGTYLIPNERFRDVLDQFIDYAVHVDKSLLERNRYLDRFLPDLREADRLVPKCFFERIDAS